MINNLITQVLKVQSDTFKCLILWDRAWASVSGPCEEAPVGSAGPSRASAGSDAGSWELINEDNRDGGEEQKSPVIIDKKLPEESKMSVCSQTLWVHPEHQLDQNPPPDTTISLHTLFISNYKFVDFKNILSQKNSFSFRFVFTQKVIYYSIITEHTV